MIVWSDRQFHTRYYTPAFPVSGSYSSLLSTHNVTEQRGPSTTGLSLYHWLSAPSIDSFIVLKFLRDIAGTYEILTRSVYIEVD
ncbi:MAG: hypothetical protein VZQ98_16220 [Bacteroidales bacterium]|nr:hypothetical protein [Bacteroidales bacterium]